MVFVCYVPWLTWMNLNGWLLFKFVIVISRLYTSNKQDVYVVRIEKDLSTKHSMDSKHSKQSVTTTKEYVMQNIHVENKKSLRIEM